MASFTTPFSGGDKPLPKKLFQALGKTISWLWARVFWNGHGSDDCDAVIERTAYLSLVSNATQVYDVMIILKKYDQVKTYGKLHIFTTNEAY